MFLAATQWNRGTCGRNCSCGAVQRVVRRPTCWLLAAQLVRRSTYGGRCSSLSRIAHRRPCTGCCQSRSRPLQPNPLPWRPAAPDAVVDARVDCELAAEGPHGTGSADRLGRIEVQPLLRKEQRGRHLTSDRSCHPSRVHCPCSFATHLSRTSRRTIRFRFGCGDCRTDARARSISTVSLRAVVRRDTQPVLESLKDGCGASGCSPSPSSVPKSYAFRTPKSW